MTAAGAVVLDASAALAWFFDEPGSDVVDPLLPGAVLSTVNLVEVWQTLDDRGADADRAVARLRLLGARTAPFPDEDALLAGRLRRTRRGAGLSLGDRCCLATAVRLGRTAVTANRAWAELELPVEVRVIR